MRIVRLVLSLLFLAVGLTLAVSSAVAATTSVEVALESDQGSVKGTLLLPDSNSPAAVALIISGSGPTDRDGNSPLLPGKNNSLKMIAEGLAEANIASLRFDKRLIGESAEQTISESDLRFDTYVEDARSWLAMLGERFDAPLIVIGHSEGALIALLAAEVSGVAGVIAIAGPGGPAGELILDQMRPRLPPDLMGATEHIVAELVAGRTVADTPAPLAPLFRDSVQPYMISWFAYDPADIVSNLGKPVLLVYGTTDLQVPVSHGERLEAASDNTSLVIIEGMNHVLKMEGGATLNEQLSSYGDPTLALSEELMNSVTQFIQSEAAN